MNNEWREIASCPDGVVVMTKIDDNDGIRNDQTLIKKGIRFFIPDMSMYVYYRPTHWKTK